MKEQLRVSNERLEKLYKLLETLEGYQKLTPRQQNIVRSSLLIQQAAMLPNTVPDEYTEGKSEMNLHVAYWYCHAAVAALEQNMHGHAREQIPNSFFEADYERPASMGDVIKMINETGFPCVILIGTTKKYLPRDPNLDHDSAIHTALALGYDSSGEIIIWEKKGTATDYQLSKLKELYDYYKAHHLFWGARPLKKL